MILKEIIMNGQLKRDRPALERVEAVTTAVRAMAISTQQVTAAAALRPIATAAVRPAPHFTCNAETLVAML